MHPPPGGLGGAGREREMKAFESSTGLQPTCLPLQDLQGHFFRVREHLPSVPRASRLYGTRSFD